MIITDSKKPRQKQQKFSIDSAKEAIMEQMLKDKKLKSPAEELQEIRDKEKRELLTWENNQVTRFLETEPADVSGLCLESGWTFPKEEVSMLIAQGGTGKSFFLLGILAAMAAGVPYGKFRPKKPYKVLGLFGEDSAEMLHKRAKSILQTNPELQDKKLNLNKNFNIKSVINFSLVEFGEHQNPVPTENYYLLRDMLQDLKDKKQGIEFLVIDPLIRFYGLDENNNQHASFFIDVILGELQRDFNLSIIVSHHISKSDAHLDSVFNLDQLTPRGASAFLSNARYALGMATMTQSDAKELKVPAEMRKKIVAIQPIKNNYTGSVDSPAFFKRSFDGALMDYEPRKELNELIEDELLSCLAEWERAESISITYEKKGKGKSIETKTDTAVLPANRPLLTKFMLTRNKENVEAISIIQRRLTAAGLKNLQQDLGLRLQSLVEKNKIQIEMNRENQREEIHFLGVL